MAILLDATGGTTSDSSAVVWQRTPYGIAINEDPSKAFKTIYDYVQNVIQNNPDTKETDVKNSVLKWMNIVSNADKDNAGYDMSRNKSQTGDDASLIQGKTFYSAPNYTDTRVGGNDAINPYWQFNRDDDITPPMFSIGGGDDSRFYSRRGMGRVYAETYEANQRVLWLQFGVPEYRNIADLLLHSGDASALQTMTQGSIASLGMKIVRFVIKGALWFITFPITAPLFAVKWMSTLGSNDITKFYRFRPAMPLYFDMVNSMLAYLAVSMGLYPQYIVQKGDTRTSYDKNKKAYAMVDESDKFTSDASGVAKSITPDQIDNSSIPEILKNGPDIYIMLNRRAMLFREELRRVSTRDILANQQSAMNTPDSKIAETRSIDPADPHGNEKSKMSFFNMRNFSDNSYSKKGSQSYLQRVFGSLKSTMYGTFDFVGFRVEKGVSTNESVSNSTATSPLFEKLNEMARSRQSQQHSVGDSWVNKKIWNAVQNGFNSDAVVKDMITDVVAKVMEATGFNSAASIINSGNGFFEMPEMWQDSRFSKSQSFTIQLRARYGDPVSVFQSIYVPLMMLLAAACPRSVGDNMYTSPFILKAYCKGMFSVPCGIIESLDITRGKDEFGWSSQLLPTAVDVRVTIKDLTPVMFLAMQDIGFFDTFSRNENMLDYLDTLSALTIRDRMYALPRAARKFATAILVKKNTIFSPEWWGVRAGNTTAGNIFANMNPWMPVAHEKTDASRYQ